MKKEKAIKLTEEEKQFIRHLRKRANDFGGYPFEECARWAAEQMEYETRDALKAEAARLEALDTTEGKTSTDSAHNNAGDTCAERFEDAGSYPDYSTNYFRHYVASLAMLVEDTAGGEE